GRRFLRHRRDRDRAVSVGPARKGCHAAGPAAATGLSRDDARLELRFDRGSRRRAGFISCGASLLKPAHKTDYGGYSGYFGDPDNHPWEVVVAPGIEVGDDRRVHLPD